MSVDVTPISAGVAALFFASSIAMFASAKRLRQSTRIVNALHSPLFAGACVTLLTGADPSWLGLLTGALLIGIALTGAWGPEFNSQFLLRRQSHRPYTQPGIITSLSRSRHSDRLGRILIALAVALIGATAAHFAVLVAFLIADGWLGLRLERAWRTDGRNSAIVGPLWSVRTLLSLLVVMIVIGSSGAVLDGSLVWLPPGVEILEAAPLLQTLFATELAVAGIGGASIGIALQLRSNAFGSEIASALLPRWQLIAAVPIVATSLLIFVALLGRGDASSWVLGLLPSIAVQLALLTVGYVVWLTYLVLSSAAKHDSLVEFVSDGVLRQSWPDEVRLYGWNADRGRPPPDSIRLLERSILGAMTQSDTWLIDALIYNWTFKARTESVLHRITMPPGNPNRWREAQLEIVLEWDEVDYFDGLDIAIQRLLAAVAAHPRFDAYLGHFTPLVNLVYPAVGRDRQYRSSILREEPPPGFRSLFMLTALSERAGRTELVHELVARYWQDRVKLGVVWSERITPADDGWFDDV
ncbi:MAG: hypothetical protein GEU80_17240 [Dehalococcoidia bacterium]|nr:hypothetical protein [Dehalococcoidia bacterium]